MDALMSALVAALLIHADGRAAGRLAALLHGERTMWHRTPSVMIVLPGVLLVILSLSALAGAQASQMVGQGLLQLVLVAGLVSGLWVARAPSPPAQPTPDDRTARHGALAALVQDLVFGPLPLICLALAGISGGGPLAVPGTVLGALLGIIAAVVLPLVVAGPDTLNHWPQHLAARMVRLAAAAALLLWAALALRTAFGI